MMNLGELQYCVAQEILSLSHEVSVRTFTDNTDEWIRVVLAEFVRQLLSPPTIWLIGSQF